MARKKSEPIEVNEAEFLKKDSDPMATVIEEMPEPSEFADTIQPPQMDDDNLAGEAADNGESSFSFDDSPTQSAPANDTPETFDPSIHCVDANGNPKLTKAGKFRRKRGKAGATAMPNPNQVDPMRMQNASAAAQVAVAATFLAGQIAFGPEGQPMENEAETMQTAYQQFFYLSEKPITIQPWVLVAMVSSTYIAKRMAMEEPRNRVMRGVDWLSEKAGNVWRWVWGS